MKNKKRKRSATSKMVREVLARESVAFAKLTYWERLQRQDAAVESQPTYGR